MLTKKLSPYLLGLTKKHPEISRQFVYSGLEEKDCISAEDPLMEEKHSPVKGLIHKYHNRVLVLLTLNCVAYCRFCARRRKVSDVEKGVVTVRDLDAMVKYVKNHPEVNEVIFSGGDPLIVPTLLKIALQKFSRLPQIKIIRVSTRLHFSNPLLINDKVVDALKVVKHQPLYLLLHFNHPAELAKATLQAINKLQKASTMLLSQTVSLKGVNDSADVLEELFTKLVEIGVKPYYFHRCDPARGARHFIVDFKKEVAVVTELYKRLSGLACPLYVIDTPGGKGKVPIPLNFWDICRKKYHDYEGNIFGLE